MSHMSEKSIDDMNNIKERSVMVKNKFIVGLLCLMVVFCAGVSYWMTAPLGDEYSWMRNVLTLIITLFFLGVGLVMNKILKKVGR